MKQFRIDQCVNFLEEKFDSTVGVIIRAMFKISEYSRMLLLEHFLALNFT